jgi:hypothetical protein
MNMHKLIRFPTLVLSIAAIATDILFGIPLVSSADPATNIASTPFTIPVPAVSGSIAIDTAAAPDLTDWADHTLAPVLAAWYPKIVAMLPSPGFVAPANFTVTIRPMDGVAYTTGTNVVVSADWCRHEIEGQAIGSVVHEMVHVVQQYGRLGYGDRAPGWLVEGMADYVRWFKFEPKSHGADIVWMRRHGKHFSPHYDDSYRVSANFLNWVTEKYDSNMVTQVNAVLREGNYTDDFWKQRTDKTVQELGAEWRQKIETQLSESPEPKI